MKLTHYIYISTALATLAACSDDDLSQRGFTVGEADNAIVLQAGVREGGSGVQTRAAVDPTYYAFQTGTALALRVDGTWLGKGFTDNLVSKPTTGAINAEADNDKDLDTDEDSNKDTRGVSMNPQLYWDDYGTADPANMPSVDGNGREKGLTIYGAAVDGETTAPTIDGSTGKMWTDLSWNVGTLADGVIDQSGTNYWKASDLLTSNNVTAETGADGTYKFDQRTSGNLLKFTHAMTKMTVELKAGVGFEGGKFVDNPTVTLKGFHYTGSVDIENKTSKPASDKANIKMHLASGGASAINAVFDALVFPHDLTDNTDDFADTDEILTLTADGNTYVVNATNLNAAIQNAINDQPTSGYPSSVSTKHLLQGWNYKLVIIVNKTEIKVIATVVDWKDVTADEEAPKISINDTYGHTGTAFEKDFDFFRSTLQTEGYSKDAYVKYAKEGEENTYTFYNPSDNTASPLYWPTHNTHYFFRGVWPRVGTNSGEILSSSIDADKSKISVENVAYAPNTYPSDLMMARPLKDDDTAADETCKVAAHKDSEGKAPEGICATEGEIRMNFHYMMSQVIVELSTSASTASDHVNIDDKTTVEIIGGYKSGAIAFSGCNAVFAETDKGDYQMKNKATNDYDSYHDAIIPQSLDGLKFRIKVTNSDGSIDVYECPIKDIKVSENGSTPAPVNEWAAGKKYTYNLTVKKTAIKVSATLTDWIPVEANQDVWF